MTEEEWGRCDNPARMRKTIAGRGFPKLRWVLFDLACIARVQDLIDDQGCLDCIRLVEDRVGDSPPPVAWFSLGQAAAANAIGKVRQRYTDPFQQARLAALRAIERLASGTLVTSEMVCTAAGRRVSQTDLQDAARAERKLHADFLRCLFGNPFRPVAFDPAWRTSTAVAIAKGMYESRGFGAMPILGDALQDAGCDNDEVLNHCRGDGPHVRGCWAVDLVLGKE